MLCPEGRPRPLATPGSFSHARAPAPCLPLFPPPAEKGFASPPYPLPRPGPAGTRSVLRAVGGTPSPALDPDRSR